MLLKQFIESIFATFKHFQDYKLHDHCDHFQYKLFFQWLYLYKVSHLKENTIRTCNYFLAYTINTAFAQS